MEFEYEAWQEEKEMIEPDEWDDWYPDTKLCSN